MKKLILLLAIVSLFSCKKKEDTPKPKINYVSYKVDGKLYETTAVSVEKDMSSLFFWLKAEADGNILSIPLFTKGPGKYNLSSYATYRDTLKKMTAYSGEAEVLEYKPVSPGSIMSGKFSFYVQNTGGQPSSVSISEGTFINIQSKEW